MTSLEEIRSRFKFEFVAQVIGVVAGGVLTVVLARLLTPDDYGLLYLSLSVFTVLAFCSKLGLASSAAKYVSEYRATDPSQIPHIVRYSVRYTLLATILTAGAAVVFRAEIAALIGEPALEPFLVVGAVFLVGTTFMGYVRTLLQGFEEIQYSAILTSTVSLIKLPLAVGLVLLGFDALGALFGYGAAMVLVSVVGAVVLYRTVAEYDVAERFEDGLGGRILRYNVPILFTRGSNVLDKQVDTILVGFFLTPVAVSYYVVSKQVVSFVQAPAAALGFTISPTLGKQKAADDLSAAARMYESSVVHVLLLYVPAAAGIAITARPAIQYTFGPSYAGAAPVLQVLSLFVLLQALMQVTSTALDFLGRARIRAIVKGVTAVANVILNLVLIPQFGVVGAAVATVFTYSIYTGANLTVITRELPLRRGHIARRLGLIVGVTALMSAVVMTLLTYVTNVFTLVGLVALGGLTWFVLSLVTGLLEWDDITAAV